MFSALALFSIVIFCNSCWNTTVTGQRPKEMSLNSPVALCCGAKVEVNQNSSGSRQPAQGNEVDPFANRGRMMRKKGKLRVPLCGCQNSWCASQSPRNELLFFPYPKFLWGVMSLSVPHSFLFTSLLLLYISSIISPTTHLKLHCLISVHFKVTQMYGSTCLILL